MFIQAKNLHYGVDFVPGFWDWLQSANESGLVASVSGVLDEILAVNDDLSIWAAQRGHGFFIPPDEPILPALAQVANWANGQNFDAAAVATFLQVADYWLVSHALAHDFIVVTHEIPANSIKKIKIPNACIGVGVRCVTPFEMLRNEAARFVLATGQPK